MYDTNPDKLKTFWSGFSGQWDSLVKAINTGYNKKALGYLGAPNPVAVAVTTASPILVKLSKFLKSIGIDPETIQELAQEKLNQVAQNVVSKVRKEAKEKIYSMDNGRSAAFPLVGQHRCRLWILHLQ